MKTFKICLSIVLLLLAVSCKKNDEVEQEETKIDLTTYFITWEVPTTFSGGRTYNLPVLMFFGSNNQVTIHWFSTANNPPKVTSYKLEDNKIIVNNDNFDLVFNLDGDNITSTSGTNFKNENVKLRKLPPTNQFVGKYSGMLTSRHVNTAFPFKYVFNQTQFGEESVAEPTLDYAINPIHNVFATTYIDGIIRHFLIVDGKLTVVRIHVGATNASTFLCAKLAKDQ